MADVKKLRDLLDSYGIAVRAGVITPCLEDENEFRSRMGLKPAPPHVVDAWTRSRGIRTPGEETVTSAMLGELQPNLAMRTEFLALARED